jgi:hypothetical protein
MNKTIIITMITLIVLCIGIASAEVIYQENPNSSSVSGAWVGNGSNLTDGNWDTYDLGGSSYTTLYVNYTKPTDASAAIWRFKDDTGEYNSTLPDICFNADTNNLILQVQILYMHLNDWEVFWRCYDGSIFEDTTYTYTRGPGRSIYEEGIYWNITEKETPNNANSFTGAAIDTGVKLVIGFEKIALLLGIVIAGIGITYGVRKLILKK